MSELLRHSVEPNPRLLVSLSHLDLNINLYQFFLCVEYATCKARDGPDDKLTGHPGLMLRRMPNLISD